MFTGDLSRTLLASHANLTLLMVDSWEVEPSDSPYRLTGDPFGAAPQESHDEYMRIALEQIAPFRQRAVVLRGRSIPVSKLIPDRWLDFVFIDADHSYVGVTADISAWEPKVRSGGWIGGHDYENTNPTFGNLGVTRAVDEYVAFRGLTLEKGRDMTWFTQLTRS